MEGFLYVEGYMEGSGFRISLPSERDVVVYQTLNSFGCCESGVWVYWLGSWQDSLVLFWEWRIGGWCESGVEMEDGWMLACLPSGQAKIV